MKRILCAFFIAVCCCAIFAEQSDVSDPLLRGLDAYSRSDWAGAVVALKKAVAGSNTASSEAWYWLVMAQTAAGDYDAALHDADYFLSAWPQDPRFGDMMYQKGRVFYQSAKYNEAVRTLGVFITNFPNNAFVAAGYFWIGESLFALGRFDEAAVLYGKIISDYPLSVKKESAGYRLAIINQKEREEELLEILKWSHEESLKVVEEYQKRERSYEQALGAYQKKIVDMQKTTHSADIEQELGQEKLKNAELLQKNAELQKINDELMTLMESKCADQQNVPIQTDSELDIELPYDDVRQRLESLRKKAIELETSVQ